MGFPSWASKMFMNFLYLVFVPPFSKIHIRTITCKTVGLAANIRKEIVIAERRYTLVPKNITRTSFLCIA